MHFGEDAVFIDREIPPGKKWEDHLESMLTACTGVVVLVGDEFLRRLRRPKGRTADATQGAEAMDPLVWEISTAIGLNKPIYPVLFGAIDMPSESQLPESMRAIARYQAVFAREPAFDSAMVVLVEAIRAEHGLEPASAKRGGAPAAAATSLYQALRNVLLAALAGVLLLGTIGSLVTWLGSLPVPDGRWFETALWRGAQYLLCTLLLGLGPYASYWLVAVLRARARLPIRNLSGLLAAFNVGGVLVLGGMFLLLSTIPQWRLLPLWVFPGQPTLLHYGALALALLCVPVAALIVAVWEPKIRTMQAQRRSAGIAAINTAGVLVALFQVWFAASLLSSAPATPGVDPIALLGYLLLCPTLSLLYAYGWKFGRTQLDPSEKGWEFFFLFTLVLSLVFVCTLALYSYGVAKVLAPS